MSNPHPSDIAGFLVQRWQAFGDLPALRLGATGLSYRQLGAQVGLWAQRLRETGVAPGDRVMLLFPNTPDLLVAALAALACGAIVEAFDDRAGRQRLDYVAGLTEPSLCLHCAGVHPPEGVAGLEVVLDPDHAEGAITLGDISPCAGDDTALLLFSSGSTGLPKGVEITHRQQIAVASNLAKGIGIRKGMRELVVAPLTHSDGWQRALAALATGLELCFPEGLISIKQILDDVTSLKIDTLFLHPAWVRYLLRDDCETVRNAFAGVTSLETGSATLWPEEVARLRDWLPETAIHIHYGISESPRSTLLDLGAHPDRLAGVGRPLPGVELRIVGDDGREVMPGEVGQILIAGDHLSRRYWRMPGLSEERFQGGWLLTGDYGRLDGDRFLTFAGRKDDLIASGGYCFYPAEVESELGEIPGVADYLVVGIPDAKGMLGEEPWLFVVPSDPDWSSRLFFVHARGRLEPYMMPRRVVLLDAIPRTDSGKPHRQALRRQYTPSNVHPHQEP